MAEDIGQNPEETQSPAIDERAITRGANSSSDASRKKSAWMGGGVWLILGLIFMALSLMGIFTYASGSSLPWILGAGLLGWGLLDLANSARGMNDWKSKGAKARNLLNLARGLFLAGLGGFLLVRTLTHALPLASNSLLLLGVGFMVLYLVVAYVVELTTESRDVLPHAMLLSALALQFLAFVYLSVPFTLTWASVFGFTSLLFATLAILRGALKANPSVAGSVALATIGLALPLVLFLLHSIWGRALQPVQQETLFVPRFQELHGPVSRQAHGLAWSPVHSQASVPGLIAYSDKLAYLDRQAKTGNQVLNIYVQNERKPYTLNYAVSSSAQAAWWAPDARQVLVTSLQGKPVKGELSIYNWVDPTDSSTAVTRSATLKADVMQQRAHGQIWTPKSDAFYYAAPSSAMKQKRVKLAMSSPDFSKKPKILAGGQFRFHPALNQLGDTLLYVSHEESKRVLEIGQGSEGAHVRQFSSDREKHRFPAWNAKQTHVLFFDAEGTFKFMSSNDQNDAQPFENYMLNSKIWKTQSNSEMFTLDEVETGSRGRIFISRPDGRREKLIYETNCSEIFPPIWSNDGRRIAMIIRDGRRYSILTMNSDGSWPTRFFLTHDRLRQLSWCPDSAHLAYLCDRNEGKQELWIAAADGTSPERLYESHGQLSSLSWSPEGQHVAVEEKDAYTLLGFRIIRPDLFGIMVVDIKDRKARSLTAGRLFARQPAFSPHGSMMGFFTDGARWSLSLNADRAAVLAVSQLR